MITARVLAPVGLFALTFSFSAALLSEVSPRGGVALRHVLDSGEYDTIFVGSSHLLNGLDPRVFDRVMRERGVPTHSFVVASSGMKLPELSYVVEKILEAKLPRLRRIVIEPRWPKKSVAAIEQFENRDLVDWHDFNRTRLSVTAAWLAPQKPVRRARRILAHFQLFARNVLALGFGRSAIAQGLGLGSGPPGAEAADLIESGGFRARRLADQEEPGAFASDGQYADTLARYRRAIARMPSRVSELPESRFKIAAVHALIQRIADAGLQPIVLTFPTVDEKEHYFRRNFVKPRGLVFEFDDPESWQELYDPGLRVDPNHFEARGAVRFSTVVAEAFSRQLEAERP